MINIPPLNILQTVDLVARATKFTSDWLVKTHAHGRERERNWEVGSLLCSLLPEKLSEANKA